MINLSPETITDPQALFGIFVALFAAFFLIMLILVLATYIYTSLAIMAIAKRTKTENAWLAWIPIANFYLITQIAKQNGLWTLALLAGFIPFIGPVDFGILYPLLLIPIGVVGASNMVNLLGGLNGIETGMGLVYTGMLSIYAYTLQEFATAALGAIAFMALLAFLYYNKYPAKIFPGDSLTYLLGLLCSKIHLP